MAEEIYPIVIGTAGHIDHGKSTVVTRLTGINPDRLPEEQAREMTIDIGFANFLLKSGRRVGVIDVPGHEDFIKNMLAGATGVDLVLLVVSGVEGVMPQTVEHLRILDLLGLRKGLVLINMVDLADADTLALVEDDIRDTTRGTFLEGASILKVSAKTGEGFDALLELLDRMVREIPPKDAAGPFRMPIQRIFSKKGFGTIVTGVPISGRCAAGDAIEILPAGRRVRVKSMQAYGRPVEVVRAGHSSALNVSDVAVSDVHRGDVAAAPGFFEPSAFVEGTFRFLPDISRYMPEGLRTLRSFMPIKFHCGTKEAEGKIVVLDKPKLEPGESAFVQFRLAEPVVVAEGDRFIVRIATPTYTIGGGQVVDVSGQKLKRFQEAVMSRLLEKSTSLEERDGFVEFAIKDLGYRFGEVKDVIVASHAAEEAVRPVIERLKQQGKLRWDARGRFLHVDTLAQGRREIAREVRAFHEKNPLRAGVTRVLLRQLLERRGIAMEEAVFELLLGEMVERGELAREGEKYRLPEFRVKMSREDTEIAAELERIYVRAGLQSPRLEEVVPQLKPYPAERVKTVAEMLVDQGALVALKDEVILHREAVAEACRKVADAIRAQGPLEPGRIREVLNTSRKYLIPLLEHLDDIGLTVRVENRRALRQSAAQ